MIKKFIAGAGIAVLVTFGSSLAATAAPGDTYVAASDVVVADSTPVPGQAVDVGFADGAFNNGENVNFQVEGEGTVTLAMVKAAVVSLTKTASGTGAVSVTVTLPANARGTYTVTATGLTSGTVGTAALTVAAADAGAAAADAGAVLPSTGGQIPVALIWIAGSAVALGLILIVVIRVRGRTTLAA